MEGTTESPIEIETTASYMDLSFSRAPKQNHDALTQLGKQYVQWLKFDSVVSRNSLMFMPDPLKALKRFLRVLKAGGKASLTIWGSPDKSPVMGAVMNIVSTHVPGMKQSSPGTPGGPFSIPSVDMLRDLRQGGS